MILGLTGRARVGKTTLAEELELRNGFVIKSFATPLKHGLSVMTGLDPRYFTDPMLKNQIIPSFGTTPRLLMQRVATDAIRTISPNFWVVRMRQELRKDIYQNVKIVIDDCRFENEVQLIRDLGGQIIHLKRNQSEEEDSHISERPLAVRENDLSIQSGDYGLSFTYNVLMEKIYNEISSY